MESEAFSRNRSTALHHMELPRSSTALVNTRTPRPSPQSSGTDAKPLPFRRSRIRSHARARPSANLRASDKKYLQRNRRSKTRLHPKSAIAKCQGCHSSQGCPTSGRSCQKWGCSHPLPLDKALLRFQCLHDTQDRRETSLHAPESRHPRIGRTIRTMEVEQLSFLRVRRNWISQGERLELVGREN